MNITAYSKVFAVGHREISDLLHQPIWAEEKVDGSQFSFGMLNGKLMCRSRTVVFDVEDPTTYKAFALAVDYVKEIADKLIPDYTYRGEFLSKLRHNVLCYGRVPLHNIVIWDIKHGGGTYFDYDTKKKLAQNIDLETVALLNRQPLVIETLADMDFFLKEDSMLGHCKVEGVVFKRHDSGFNLLVGKHVSDRFKEKAQTRLKNKGAQGPTTTDRIIEVYKTDARWEKAVQHLRDNGQLKQGPEDIGPLMKELSCDLSIECGDEIKELMFKYEWKKVVRGVSHGFADWYKRRLAAEALNG